MSSISIDAPTVQISSSGLENLVNFIHAHEQSLKRFGGIKIQLSPDCTLALKKRKFCPTCTTIQQITKLGKNERIYQVEKIKDANMYAKQRSSIIDEETFWSSLSDLSVYPCEQSSVSVLPNKTLFYDKCHRKGFTIHSVPRCSLLKLGGTKVVNQFVSCLTRTHGPGAIFPLSTAQQQRLSVLVYHHQGGARHWYIIPTYEREALQKIFRRQNSSNCLEHGNLLIDPIILDKNRIRYHRLVQYPNEFIVLSAGTLAQSFTVDASWSESIAFALPSWIKEGHATATDSLCQCNINIASLPKTVDFSLFKPELIQKYIDTHLNIPNHVNTSISEVETIPLIIQRPIISLHRVTLSYNEFPSSLIISPVNKSHLNEDEIEHNQNNPQRQLELYRVNEIHDTTQKATSTEQNLQSYLSEYLQIQGNQNDTFLNTPQNPDNQLCSFDDIMDIISHTPATTLSTNTQFDELINTSEQHQSQQLNPGPSILMDTTAANTGTRNNLKKKDIIQTINCHKKLFVSGLRYEVNKSDIYRHFIGCTKVTLKRCQSTSHLHLKYALISHRTMKDAQRNFLRPIDHILLGPECYVEYARDDSSSHNNYRSCHERTVVIKNIPENVTENDLRCLFTNCHISKYCPARAIHRMATSTALASSTKTLWGYAFLVYNNIQQAAAVVEHADQYQINGRPLIVSFYCNTKQH